MLRDAYRPAALLLVPLAFVAIIGGAAGPIGVAVGVVISIIILMKLQDCLWWICDTLLAWHDQAADARDRAAAQKRESQPVEVLPPPPDRWDGPAKKPEEPWFVIVDDNDNPM